LGPNNIMETIQTHGKLFWLLLIPIIIAIISAVNFNVGMGLLFPISLLLFVSIIFPIKKLGVNSRGIAIGSLLLAFLACAIFVKDEDTLRLEALKKENPVAYLAEIKTDKPKLWAKEARTLAPDDYLADLEANEPLKWIDELKALKPDEYAERETELEGLRKGFAAKAEQDRLDKIETLKTAALAIPASDFAGNIKAYKELSRLDPENQSYKDKIASYEAKQKDAKATAARCGSGNYHDAYFYGKEYVKRNLKAPSSAKFGSYGNSSVQHYKGCKFVVNGYVDSQNSFGAMLRSNYSVTLTPNGLNWTLLDIQIQ